MNQFSSGGAKPWEVYTTTDPSSSQTVASTESPVKNDGTSLNAISFGYVATAILIAMFLIMAIFEHLLRPTSEDGAEGSIDTGPVHILDKLASPQNVSPAYANDISILMPGQHRPTFIAKPAPLPCRREGILLLFHRNLYRVSFKPSAIWNTFLAFVHQISVVKLLMSGMLLYEITVNPHDIHGMSVQATMKKII